ncbi:MAG: hypothetical protein IJM59_08070 [Proteobacteria bacterium]|nr:hypothetical protein [Pseudomonadota bacterium]
MTFTRKLLTLSAITALSLSLAACGDDGDSSSNNNNNNGGNDTTTQTPQDGTTCTAADAKCIGNIAITCNNGKSEKIDCQKEGKICDQATATCKVSNEPQTPPPTGECTKGTFKCDGNTLMGCPENTWTEVQKCADGKTCNEAEGKCDEPAGPVSGVCDPAKFQSTCPKKDSHTICDGGQIKTETCPGDKPVCSDGQCVACKAGEKQCGEKGVETCEAGGWKLTQECKDPTPKCSGDSFTCVAEGTAPADDKGIGAKCSCTDPDCKITITGKELYAALNSEDLEKMGDVGKLISIFKPGVEIDLNIKTLLDGLNNDNVKVEAPYFFSDKVVGCSDIKVDGMATGCLHDATITFAGLDSLVKTVLDALSKAGFVDEKMTKSLNDVLANGIPFKSKDGYCLTAAINISEAGSGLLHQYAPGLISTDKTSLVNAKRINVGDHAKAQNAKCPDGAVRFSYTVDYPGEGASGAEALIGQINVGFDMCLKSCNQDSDCRDGYVCYEIPNGVPEEGKTVPTQKACFDNSTIKYFTDMTNAFKKE